MGTCSRTGILSLYGLAVLPRNLIYPIFRLPRNLIYPIFRVLLKLLHLPPGLLKKLQEDGHADPPSMGTASCTSLELPQDILMDIFATLEMPDLLRAGSVCTSWRSVYTTLRDLGKYKLCQTPCLFYTSESAGDNVACLYSLVEKKTYRLTLPEPPIRNRYLIGSSNGWLVTVDDRSEMHLVNPITSEQIALPSVITMEHVKPVYNKSGAVSKYEYSWHTATETRYAPSIFSLRELQEYLYCKAFVFPEKSRGNYIVVLIHNPISQLSFARVGDDKWTWMPPHTHYEDCTYKDGFLYANTWAGEIHAFDLSGPVVTMEIVMRMTQKRICNSLYIVYAPCGDLLNIWRAVEDEDENAEPATVVRNTVEIEIHKVDTTTKTPVKCRSLNGHVLFLGHNQSLCLSAKEYTALKENHAYFTDNHELWTKGFKNNRRDIGVFDLENKSKDELVSPQLWSNWPTPVWITPSLAKLNIK